MPITAVLHDHISGIISGRNTLTKNSNYLFFVVKIMTNVSLSSSSFNYPHDQNKNRVEGSISSSETQSSGITPSENPTAVSSAKNPSSTPFKRTHNAGSVSFLTKMAKEFGNRIDLGASRSQHFELMASMPEGLVSKRIGQITHQYREGFLELASDVLPKKYIHPGGVEKLRLGNADFYFANTSAKNGPIVFFAHGLLESSKDYAPSAYQADSTRFFRPNSRADEALHKDYNVAAISFKNDMENSPLIPSNKDLESAVVNAVKSFKNYIEERGEKFNPSNIILVGKSRGVIATLAAIPALRQNGINIGRIILEAPFMNAATLRLNRTTESLKSI